MNPIINLSTLTHVVSLTFILIGYVSPIGGDIFLTTGLFAISGSITNALAIHMLFEKIPGLHGSGVIPSRFEEFKEGIRSLIMNQFFTPENIKNFFKESSGPHFSIDAAPVLNALDYDEMFQRLQEVVLKSSFGGMLSMFGGPQALEPLKSPFKEMIQHEIKTLLSSPSFLKGLQSSLGGEKMNHEISDKIHSIVQKRLDELTPDQVKTIIQDMIRKHLGWLVVWGGVFGGLLGCLGSLLLF